MLNIQSQEYESYKFSVFIQNLKEIDELNNSQTSARFGVNHFTDLTQEEFMQLHVGGVQLPEFTNSFDNYVQTESTAGSEQSSCCPASSDLRQSTNGYLKQVKNQVSCGNCVAFAVLSQVEFLYSKKNQNVTLSEQQLVDCGWHNMSGCDGFWFVKYYQYTTNTGVALSSRYPYVGHYQGYSNCKESSSGQLYKISRFKQIESNFQSIKKALVEQGPVAVCADATNWNSFQGGVLNLNMQGNQCNQAVVLVGYKNEYLILRNSWGTAWAEKGYIRLAYNPNQNSAIIKYAFQPY